MNERSRTERHLLRLRRRYGSPGRAWGPVAVLPARGCEIFLPHLLHPDNQRDETGRRRHLLQTTLMQPRPSDWWAARGFTERTPDPVRGLWW